MIVSKLLPEIYYKESRDFAYVGRLLEVIFNYMKTGADSVLTRFDNTGSEGNTVNLLVDTLGFDLKHDYLDRDLVYIASALTYLLRNKGAISAVELAVRLMLNSQKVPDMVDFEFCTFDQDQQELTINIPDSLSDIVLLEDLLEYILPAGVTYRFVRFNGYNPNQYTESHAYSQLDSKNRKHVGDMDLGSIRSESDKHSQDDQLGSFYLGVVVTDETYPHMCREGHTEDQPCDFCNVPADCSDNNSDGLCDLCGKSLDNNQ